MSLKDVKIPPKVENAIIVTVIIATVIFYAIVWSRRGIGCKCCKGHHHDDCKHEQCSEHK